MVHWGVFRHLRAQIGARSSVLLLALAADAIVLVAFAGMKLKSDPAIVAYAAAGILAVFVGEGLFLRRNRAHRSS